jgi:hypothetical protein
MSRWPNAVPHLSWPANAGGIGIDRILRCVEPSGRHQPGFVIAVDVSDEHKVPPGQIAEDWREVSMSASEKSLRDLASAWLNASDEMIDAALKDGLLTEIK